MVNTDICVNKKDIVILSFKEKCEEAFKSKKDTEPFPIELCNLVKMPENSELVIHKETDYSKFKLSNLNRQISRKKANGFALHSLIKQSNYFSKNPCVISETFEKGFLTIFDGQNRFIGSTLIRGPIFYVIDNSLTEDDFTRINQYQTNWKQFEYVITFSLQRKPFYMHLVETSKKYPNMHPYLFITIYGNAIKNISTTEFSKKLKDGEMELTEQIDKDIKLFFEKLEKFKFYEFYQTRHFVRAVIKISNKKNFSEERLFRQVDMYKDLLYKCHSLEGAYNMLVGIYNRKLKTGNLK